MKLARVPALALFLTMMLLLSAGNMTAVQAGSPTTGATEPAHAKTESKQAGHGAAAAATMTMKGEILDLSCYLSHGAKGAQHQSCALTCLKNGAPMGLLTADGTVYLLMPPHDDAKAFNQAKEYAADQVEVTGTMAESAGIHAITVTGVKKV
jgi:hypothetical protein